MRAILLFFKHQRNAKGNKQVGEIQSKSVYYSGKANLNGWVSV